MGQRSGQCLCGAVRYTAREANTEYATCHCRMCQRWTGGPFFSTTVRSIEFESENFLSRFQSSEWAERGFCAKCGSNIFYRVVKTGDYEVCIGSFDDIEDFAMTSEIFVDRKPPGYALAGDHPRLTEAQTMERYKEFME